PTCLNSNCLDILLASELINLSQLKEHFAFAMLVKLISDKKNKKDLIIESFFIINIYMLIV
ncbi:hypothetical protein OAI76_04345, partial [Alphaproteobacteria bacterium]|nr:hypothetical protein [Alphaproteobacteria bacterium]